MGDVDLGKFRFINVVILSFEKAFRRRKFLFIDEFGRVYLISKYFLTVFSSRILSISFYCYEPCEFSLLTLALNKT